MSGIINSVGAKSGIIGSTEIPGGYEEGTWTPINANGITGQWGNYIKIGKVVTITMAATNDNDGVTASTWTGLPFTSNATGDRYQSITVGYQSETADVTWNGLVAPDSKTFTFRHGSNSETLSGTSVARMSGTYIAES